MPKELTEEQKQFLRDCRKVLDNAKKTECPYCHYDGSDPKIGSKTGVKISDVTLWTIYKHPKDYPDKFIARKFILDKPTDDIRIGNTLEEVRDMLPPGLIRLDRDFTDDIVIVETWL